MSGRGRCCAHGRAAGWREPAPDQVGRLNSWQAGVSCSSRKSGTGRAAGAGGRKTPGSPRTATGGRRLCCGTARPVSLHSSRHDRCVPSLVATRGECREGATAGHLVFDGAPLLRVNCGRSVACSTLWLGRPTSAGPLSRSNGRRRRCHHPSHDRGTEVVPGTGTAVRGGRTVFRHR
jgi:hypothetical protein